MEEQDPKTGESPLRLLLQEVGELRREIREQGQRLTELETALSKVAEETADMAATVEAAAVRDRTTRSRRNGWPLSPPPSPRSWAEK